MASDETGAKWLLCRYIRKTTNRETDINKHESVSDRLFQPHNRSSLCVCAWVFTCMCLHLVSIQLQDGYWMDVCVCAQPLVCICLMQSHTECFINPAKALINVINWRRLTHTPGSPALFLEPEGQWHNVHSYLESLGWNDGLKSFIPLEYCVSSLAADYLSSVWWCGRMLFSHARAFVQ